MSISKSLETSDSRVKRYQKEVKRVTLELIKGMDEFEKNIAELPPLVREYEEAVKRWYATKAMVSSGYSAAPFGKTPAGRQLPDEIAADKRAIKVRADEASAAGKAVNKYYTPAVTYAKYFNNWRPKIKKYMDYLEEHDVEIPEKIARFWQHHKRKLDVPTPET